LRRHATNEPSADGGSAAIGQRDDDEMSTSSRTNLSAPQEVISAIRDFI